MRSFLAIFVTTWLLSIFLPWWSVFVPAILFGFLFFEKSLRAFSTGFLAAGLAWLLPAVYIHFTNEAILSTRIAEMMQAGSPIVLLFVTFLIGGITGGMGTLLGFFLKSIFRPTSTTAPSGS